MGKKTEQDKRAEIYSAGSGFLKDLELMGNADLIHWHNEMIENNMPGALEDIKDEMARRFILTNWSAIEDMLEEAAEKENKV